MDEHNPKPERLTPLPRAAYKWFLPLATRWADNDQYGHINNVAYYGFFDTAVNIFLMEKAGLQPLHSNWIGLVVDTRCSYFAPLSFPQTIDIGLMVAERSRSSIRYGIGIFAESGAMTAARGHFVHVYVDAATHKPVALPPMLLKATTELLP